jgi:hypothetical protein
MNWQTHSQNAFITAGVAAAATTLAATLLSRADTTHPAAALNATSHIVWGDDAASVDGADLRHTALGALLNAGAMLAWAGVQGLLPRSKSVGGALVKGSFVTSLAYVTDYHVVPKRLTPGFEKRLSGRSLGLIYASMAAALSVGALVTARRH